MISKGSYLCNLISSQVIILLLVSSFKMMMKVNKYSKEFLDELEQDLRQLVVQIIKVECIMGLSLLDLQNSIKILFLSSNILLATKLISVWIFDGQKLQVTMQLYSRLVEPLLLKTLNLMNKNDFSLVIQLLSVVLILIFKEI